MLRGLVESVAAGIEDRDRSAGATLIANVNPTFNRVRLAQRVPVRIALDRAERGELVAGATAFSQWNRPIDLNCTEINVSFAPRHLSDHSGYTNPIERRDRPTRRRAAAIMEREPWN